ncbi:MAG: class II fructose-bisphosphate aldolase family protein [bacterium]|nr:class II fructose-bisphosphate aldolase family protein [bacterium]
MKAKIKSLREYIREAGENGVAIGHFNISNLEALHGIYNAAKKLNVPVVIGVSEGEEAFVGLEEVATLVKTIRERDQYPIFLNADHHASFESVKKCIDAGFDSVIIDAAKLPFEENVALTKKCVDYAREVSRNTGRDILVEGEIGYIGSGSNIKDTIPEGAGILTSPEEAKRFVDATGVDLLAPSIGSIHGLIKSGKPHINIEVTKAIREATNIPLVLHGGSGLRDEDFTNAIKAGVNMVHINSEIRLAFREAVEKSLKDLPGEITPAKILQPAVDAIAKVVEQRLKLFNTIQ